MKIKTNRKWLLCISFAIAAILGGSCCLFSSSSATYALTANGHPETVEELTAQIPSVYEKRAELQEQLDAVLKFEHSKDYQEIWDILERYIATEEIAGWKSIAHIGLYRRYQADQFSYDETLFNELVATIQKYDPEFKVADDMQYNNIVSSIFNSSIAEVTIVAYDMLYIGHIDMMLANMQAHLDKNSKILDKGEIDEAFIMGVNEEFANSITFYAWMAELYNRIMSRAEFAEVHAIFQEWSEKYHDEYYRIFVAKRTLQHGEETTTKQAFPYRLKRGIRYYDFDTDIASKLKETYTLEELVNYLPEYTSTPKAIGSDVTLSHDELVGFFTNIYNSERQNLKDGLLALNPSLTNLDERTTDELLELSEKYLDADTLFGHLYANARPKVKELAKLLIEFNFETLGMVAGYDADKYLPTILPTNAIMAYAEIAPVGTVSTNQVRQFSPSHDEIYAAYGKIGNAALQLDRTVTDNLLPHEDWVIPDEIEDPEDPDDSTSDDKNSDDDNSNKSDDTTSSTTKPSATFTDSPSDKTSSFLPNTGILSHIVPNAEAALGVTAIISAAIILVIIRHRSRTR